MKNYQIPKKIHYCWFGNKPLSEQQIKCIDSWKKYFPDYEIIEWNESNFNFSNNKYAREAYKAKKYAFVSDYARIKILYEYGGIYFDTDVEVIKPFDDIKHGFLGIEGDTFRVNPGLGMSAPAKSEFLKFMLKEYEIKNFIKEDGTYDLTTIVDITTDLLQTIYLYKTIDSESVDLKINPREINNIYKMNIYPKEYFCPLNLETGTLKITDKTHSIHYFNGSWITPKIKTKKKIYKLLQKTFGTNFTKKARKLCKKLDL